MADVIVNVTGEAISMATGEEFIHAWRRVNQSVAVWVPVNASVSYAWTGITIPSATWVENQAAMAWASAPGEEAPTGMDWVVRSGSQEIYVVGPDGSYVYAPLEAAA